MKNGPALKSLLFLCFSLAACSKSSHVPSSAPVSSISFEANDSTIAFPVGTVYIQNVDSTHTTLIEGQYPDSSTKQGSLAIRLIGDTAQRFRGDSLLATYVDGAGNSYTNTGDSADFVLINTYPKSYNGVVTGSFALTVTGAAGTIRFSNGSIVAIFQP
jgi:hypothetical protein